LKEEGMDIGREKNKKRGKVCDYDEVKQKPLTSQRKESKMRKGEGRELYFINKR